MAPFSVISSYQHLSQGVDVASPEIKSQWSNPSDILSLLLLVGGDVVQRALAQQTGGHGRLLPVVFSFGWVAYTFISLIAAVGDKNFLPSPELPAVVFSIGQGYVRNNNSWVIARLIRDFELRLPEEARNPLEDMLATADHGKPAKKAGLCITIFKAGNTEKAGVPHRDKLWYSGYFIAAVQLGIAAVPWGLHKVWEIFAVTLCGTALAFVTAGLPHWTRERWACRKDSNKTFVISRGNGAQHAIVIRGNGQSLDLEDLAAASGEGVGSAIGTTTVYAVLTTLWCALLVTVSGIEAHTWYLVAVGAIGMVHTVIVAGAPRCSGAFGIHLDFERVIVNKKVMKALQEAELCIPGLGRSMLTTFFPADLRDDEVEWWKRNPVKKRAMSLPYQVGRL